LSGGGCVACPPGSISPHYSTSINDCHCLENTYFSGGGCRACPPGSFSGRRSSSINDCYCGGNTRMKTDNSGCEPCPLPPTGHVFSDDFGCATKLSMNFAPGSRGTNQTCEKDADCGNVNSNGYQDRCIQGVCFEDN
jgi:hypothetical protein